MQNGVHENGVHNCNGHVEVPDFGHPMDVEEVRSTCIALCCLVIGAYVLRTSHIAVPEAWQGDDRRDLRLLQQRPC